MKFLKSGRKPDDEKRNAMGEMKRLYTLQETKKLKSMYGEWWGLTERREWGEVQTIGCPRENGEAHHGMIS